MLADEYAGHVAGLVPLGFAGHIVGDLHAVDHEVLECDVAYLAVLIVSGYDRHFIARAVVDHILEQHILHACAGGLAIFLVEEDADVEQLALAEILDADIVECYVLDQIVVATVDGEATLIIDLLLLMVEDVDVAVHEVLDGVGRSIGAKLGGTAVETYHDGVGHVGPQGGVLHGDVPASAVEALAGGIHGVAVVAVAAVFSRRTSA